MTAHTCWQTNTHSVRDQCSGKSGKRSSKEEQPCSWFRRHRYCCLSLLAMTQPAAISPQNVMFDCICSCFKLPWQQRVDRLPVWVASGSPGRPHRPLNQLTRAERSHRVCNLAHSGGVFVAPSDWLRLGGDSAKITLIMFGKAWEEFPLSPLKTSFLPRLWATNWDTMTQAQVWHCGVDGAQPEY